MAEPDWDKHFEKLSNEQLRSIIKSRFDEIEAVIRDERLQRVIDFLSGMWPLLSDRAKRTVERVVDKQYSPVAEQVRDNERWSKLRQIPAIGRKHLHDNLDDQIIEAWKTRAVTDRGKKGRLKMLKIANEYGNVDLTRQKLTKRHVHVSGKRLQPLCRKLGIKFVEAVVGFEGDSRHNGGHGYSPVKDGVVVSAGSAPKLIAAIAERNKKARQKHKQAVEGLPVLAALFTLNRRAKRCRDLAQKYCQRKMHGFASEMRIEKEEIYELKGQVLHYLVADGILANSGYHKFSGGNWTEILVGEGYSFHRPCEPQSETTESRSEIESKPKGAKEPTLAVARDVVGNYLHGRAMAAVYEWPPQEREPRLPRRRFSDEWDEDEEDYQDGLIARH